MLSEFERGQLKGCRVFPPDTGSRPIKSVTDLLVWHLLNGRPVTDDMKFYRSNSR